MTYPAFSLAMIPQKKTSKIPHESPFEWLENPIILYHSHDVPLFSHIFSLVGCKSSIQTLISLGFPLCGNCLHFGVFGVHAAHLAGLNQGGSVEGTPNSWMVYKGKSQSKMDDKWGTPMKMEIPI